MSKKMESPEKEAAMKAFNSPQASVEDVDEAKKTSLGVIKKPSLGGLLDDLEDDLSMGSDLNEGILADLAPKI